MLYDSKRKNDFLSATSNSKAIIVLETIAEMETELDVDVADADFESLSIILSSLPVISTSNYYRYIGVLREYINYELQHGRSKQSRNLIQDVSEIAVNCLRLNMYNHYPKNPADLILCLNDLFGKPEINSPYIKYYAAAILVYCGFSNQQILQLSFDSLDFSLHPTDDFYIYPEFVQALKNSYLTSEYTVRGGGVAMYPPNVNKKIIQDTNKRFFVNCACQFSTRTTTNGRCFKLMSIGKAGNWYKRYLRESNNILQANSSNDLQEKDYIIYKETFYE